MYENRAEKRRERKSEDISIVSEETGISESQVRAAMSELDPRRDYGFGEVYPGMARAPEGRAGEEWSLKPEGGWIGTRGQEMIELLEAIGLKQP